MINFENILEVHRILLIRILIGYKWHLLKVSGYSSIVKEIVKAIEIQFMNNHILIQYRKILFLMTD